MWWPWKGPFMVWVWWSWKGPFCSQTWQWLTLLRLTVVAAVVNNSDSTTFAFRWLGRRWSADIHCNVYCAIIIGCSTKYPTNSACDGVLWRRRRDDIADSRCQCCVGNGRSRFCVINVFSGRILATVFDTYLWNGRCFCRRRCWRYWTRTSRQNFRHVALIFKGIYRVMVHALNISVTGELHQFSRRNSAVMQASYRCSPYAMICFLPSIPAFEQTVLRMVSNLLAPIGCRLNHIDVSGL